MAVTPNSLVTVQTPFRASIAITNAMGTTAQSLKVGGTNGSKIVAIVATSTDTASRDFRFGILSGGTLYYLDTTTVPITAGTIAATAPVDFIGASTGLPVDNDGQKYIFLASASDTLQVQAVTAVTATFNVFFTCWGGDF